MGIEDENHNRWQEDSWATLSGYTMLSKEDIISSVIWHHGWPCLSNLFHASQPFCIVTSPKKHSSKLSMCYRCLGPPTFFPYPILSTTPLPMGHDNQQWRDLLGDLGPVYRWWCSKHCLLKGWVHCLFLCLFHFILDLFIFSSAWLLPTSLLIIMLILPCQYSWLVLLFHNYAYSHVSFPLTLIDIAFLAMLSLHAAS